MELWVRKEIDMFCDSLKLILSDYNGYFNKYIYF